jgi:hypothetical protein
MAARSVKSWRAGSSALSDLERWRLAGVFFVRMLGAVLKRWMRFLAESPARAPAVQEGWRAALLASAWLLGAAAPATPILLREQAWTPAGETLAYDMTHAASECAATRTDASEIGRALFRSPNVLGGPAARAGLSCHACHSNGRVNARFMLPELTNRAGAADVTSEWSSKVRGDGVVNPVDIPDLAGVRERTVLGHTRNPSLENFVRSVIVEEFQGHELPPSAFDGLIAYMRGLDVCGTRVAPVTLADAAEDVRRSVSAAETADAETARVVLLSAQDAMGRIVERLPASRFARDRAALEALSRELGAMRGAGDVSVAMQTVLPGWRSRFDANIARVARRERQTYFNEATLAQALAQ